MFDAAGDILYVGKAKNLKARLASYFRATGLSTKTRALVTRISQIEVTVTNTEAEALILEQNLIKANRPPYNILLRDDKSYPYVFLTDKDQFPRISLHRGAKNKKGEYFGPFPNVGAVKDSLSFLQKTFRVRQCEDSVFKNRTRPCLQYQINRCTAPCVDLISQKDYARDVRYTALFLQGKSSEITTELADAMDAAAANFEYEKAADFRDKIAALRTLQSQQVIEEGHTNSDIIATAIAGATICVHVLFIRQGRILGSRSYYPRIGLGESCADILNEFVPLFYLNAKRDIPSYVITSHPIADVDLVSKALTSEAGNKVTILNQVRSHRARWVEMALRTADQNLQTRLNSKKNTLQRLQDLQQVLELEELPERMECFDISHSSGELTVASCVVFDRDGPKKSDYRRFNIEGITPGDDYAAMEQALMRRYTRLKKGEAKMPDILFVDGGKGQLGKARDVLFECGIDSVQLIGVAKGATRKPGFETLYNAENNKEIVLNSDSHALHLIQQIRDEAHRFAITGHKNRRDKKRRSSTLEDIAGVGATKRRELLRHFGGIQEIKKASKDDLTQVNGISVHLAAEIYDFFHNH